MALMVDDARSFNGGRDWHGGQQHLPLWKTLPEFLGDSMPKVPRYPAPDVLLKNWEDASLYSFDELIAQGIQLAEARKERGIQGPITHARWRKRHG